MRRDPTPLIAFCVSLAVHGAIVGAVAWSHGSDFRAMMAQYRRPIPADHGPILLPDDIHRPDDRMGESDSTGYAINSTPGDRTMQAHEADEDQAFTSKDPQGFGAVGTDPSWNTALRGEGGTGASSPPAVAFNTPPEQPFGVPTPAIPAPPRTEPIARSNPTAPPPGDAPASPAPTNQTAAPAPPTGSPAMPPANPASPASPSTPMPPMPPAPSAGAPGVNTPSADPAIDTGSESDPFSRIGSVEYRNGRVEARFGRKVKATRPRLSLAAQVAAVSLREARVILKVSCDAAGKVIDVDILQSSGSNEIDLAAQEAMYDWWIEPPTDAAGHGVADVMVWKLSWRG